LTEIVYHLFFNPAIILRRIEEHALLLYLALFQTSSIQVVFVFR